MLKRLVSTVVMVPVFLLVVLKAPGWLFNLLVVLASAVALHELTRLLEHGGRPVHRRLGLAAGVAVTAAFGVSSWAPLVGLLGLWAVALVAAWVEAGVGSPQVLVATVVMHLGYGVGLWWGLLRGPGPVRRLLRR